MTSWSDRHACYEAAKQLERRGGGWTNATLRQVGGQYGVGVSTLRRWLKDGPPDRGRRDKDGNPVTGFRPTLEDYVAVAGSRCIKAAWEQRKDTVKVSYPRYYAALMYEGDRGLALAALNGHKDLVNHRLYLMRRPLHRNHTWYFDHFEVPVWVTIPRHRDPIKPWATVVGEGSARPILSLVLIDGRPTADVVAAALAEAAVGDEYAGTFMGGVPVQIVYDNAKENEAEAIAKGIARLGAIAAPTDPYGSWQNPAESLVGMIQREALRNVPGVTLGGTTREGRPRFMPPDRGDLWSINELARHFDKFRRHWNTRRRQPTALQGRTPVEVWREDTTPLREIDEARTVASMMKEVKPHKVLAKGVYLEGEYYLPLPDSDDPTDWKDRTVHVRRLPRNTNFIAVSRDRHFNDFRFAVNQKAVTPAHRAQLLRRRGATEQAYRQIEADTLSALAHAEATGRTAEAYGPNGGRIADSDWDDEAQHDGPDGPGADGPDDDGPLPTGVMAPGTGPRPGSNGAVTVIDTASTSRNGRRALKHPMFRAPATVAGARKERTAADRQAANAVQAAERLGLPLPSRRRDPKETR